VTPLDCLIIGHNEGDFHEMVMRTRATARFSAGYEDAKLNSVLLGGRRVHYMELLSRALEAATGQPQTLSSFRQPSLAACFLASHLRRRGLRTEIVNSFTYDRPLLAALLAERPRVVALTTTFYVEADPLLQVIEVIRTLCPDARIVVGGPYVYRLCESHDPITQDYLLQGLGADFYVVDSQGEATLAKLVTALRDHPRDDPDDVPNLIWTKDGGRTFQRTARAPEDNDIDGTAIDWSLFDADYLRPTTYMRTARSCPFACAFCCYPIMAGDHVVNDVEVVMRQLRKLRELGVENVVFVDDTLNVPLPRFKKLLRRMVEEDLGLRWMSFFRCSNSDPETFELMRAAGCAFTFLGIESGDAAVLKNMDKFADLARYEDGIRRLEASGIATHASLIVGYPGETADSVKRTVELIERSRPSFYAAQVFFHDLRSPLQQRAREFGLEGSGYTWSHASMGWQEAVGHVRAMVTTIEGSALTSSYSLGLWGMFYLMTRGITLDQVRSFLRITRDMVLEGLDEREASGFDRLVSLFKGPETSHHSSVGSALP
jgi:radical SAM PhpK family P-methyltransferase